MTKTALVTGASGFVGRHLVDALSLRGYQVHGVDLLPSPWPRDRFILGEYTHQQFDVREAFVDTSERATSFDLVVHCAARNPHRSAIDSEPLNLAYNVSLDSLFIEWAARTHQKHAVYLSSSAAYPVKLQTPWYVDSRLAESDQSHMTSEVHVPDGPYGWTKLLGERAALAARAAGLHITIVRPFSGYGEDQSGDFPFGAFRDRVRAHDDPFVIWGNADQVRDWIHISDVVGGMLACVDANEHNTLIPINLCTGVGTSLRDLATRMCTYAGYRPEVTVDHTAPMGVFTRVGDPARFHQIYTPQVTLETGIMRALPRGDA